MFVEIAEEKDIKVRKYIYHYGEYGESFKRIIDCFKIYEVVCRKKEVESTEERKENRISEGKKDG